MNLDQVKPKMFGFWLPVYDEHSARDATKMAGLPVLLIGLNAVWVAFQVGVTGGALFGEITLGFAVVLILTAFRMRAGHAFMTPLVTALSLAVFALQIYTAAIMFFQFGFAVTNVLFYIGILIVPVFIATFTIGGLRAWLWMRRNGIARTF